MTQKQEVKQAQAQGSKLFLFLSLAHALPSTFLSWKWNIKQGQGTFLAAFLSTNQSTRSKFVRSLTKMTDAEGSLKKGFQKRWDSSLLIYDNGSSSLDTRSLLLRLFLRLFLCRQWKPGFMSLDHALVLFFLSFGTRPVSNHAQFVQVVFLVGYTSCKHGGLYEWLYLDVL